MKNAILGFLIAFTALIFSGTNVAASARPAVYAKAAILYDADTGEILYENNADALMGMASTTKIMTALVALEKGTPDAIVKIADEAIGIEGTSLYLRADETFTQKELIFALLLASANDVAVALATEVGGSVSDFVVMMNEKAKEIGLSDTHFDNPHGLDGDTHYTTARDMAKLTAYAIRIPALTEIVSTKTKVIGTGDSRRLLKNHNRLLTTCDGCFGVKTGFTKKCGRCLCTACERDGKTLVCVTLGCPDDWAAHTNLYDYGFSKYHLTDIQE